MKLLIDMSLSPDWVPVLAACGWQVCHWSDVGSPMAPDTLIMKWTKRHHQIIVTQDLDLHQLLFQISTSGPSVVLLRMNDEFNPVYQAAVIRAIQHAENELKSGAILVVAGNRARLRTLPLANP